MTDTEGFWEGQSGDGGTGAEVKGETLLSKRKGALREFRPGTPL